VADTGSIRRAADQLGMTQPGLSKNLRLIEDRLGAAVFQRATSGAMPTEYGDVLIERGRQVLLDLQGIVRDVREMASDEGGLVRIGAGPLVAPMLARQIVSACFRQYPGISIWIEIGAPSKLIEEVEKGSIDFLLSRAEGLPLNANVQTRLLHTMAGTFFARRGHPLIQANAVAAARLAEWPMALPTTYPRFQEWYAAATGKPRPLIQFQCDNYDLLAEAVQATDMVSACSTQALDRLRRIYALAPLRIEGFDFQQDIHCISAVSRPMSRSAQRVLDLVEHNLQAQELIAA
jgi:DNA-binding transcriptional LysR family regulator